MKIAVIKYNAGNVVSVINALNRIDVHPVVTDDPEEIIAADKVIFPGVGEASTAMNYLKDYGLDHVISGLKQPFLGICLGLQLMCKHTEENDTECLGVFDLEVKRFIKQQKVPHMGWNKLQKMRGPLFTGIGDEAYIYFVHSYYAEIGSETIAVSDYINEFSAAIQHNNFFAIQGHPEKSGKTGQIILKNFINL